MARFDDLELASFDDIAFLVEDYVIHGSVDDEVHKYPHVPGGDTEPLGRNLYEFTLRVVFVDGHPLYPTAWPDDIAELRYRFERETVSTLVIPTLGGIQAKCIDWSINATRSMRNGERTEFRFREVYESDTIDARVSSTPVEVFAAASSANALAALYAFDGFDISIFDALNNLVSQLKAYRDQIDLYADLYTTKLEQLAAECRRLESLDDFDDCRFAAILAAVKDIGVATDSLLTDVLEKAIPIVTFSVPSLMTIAQVSLAVYGDTERAMDVLKLNPIPNPLAIPIGTALRVYAAAA